MHSAFDRENLPEEVTSLAIERLDLSVRSFNALTKKGIATVGQLLLLSTPELFRIRALGRKGLIDVQRALNLVVTDYREMHSLGGQPSEVELIRKKTVPVQMTRGGWLCPENIVVNLDTPVGVLDLSARPTNALERLGIKSVRQLMEFSKEEFRELENIGRSSVGEVQLKLSNFLSGAPLMVALIGQTRARNGASTSVGTKTFVDSMLERLPDRQRNVIADRYGLWDGILETLQDIGDKLGLTRERIRQIEKKGLTRLHRVFSHRLPSELVARKLSEYFAENGNTCGVLDSDGFISTMADDCSEHEAALAVALLNDIDSSKESLLTRSLVEPEPGIFCMSKKVASDYRAFLERIKLVLHKAQKPISEARLRADLAVEDSGELSPDSLPLLERILSISPSVVRLKGGKIALSVWTEFKSRSAGALAEAALRFIGRPAHYRDITEKINTFVEIPGGAQERTVHNAMIGLPQKFVWVGSGTYGLVAWGIEKPPYIKDRLVQLLSDARYPLPFWHLHEEVRKVCNCKEASVRMTLNLNPKVFKKFENDQYGLCGLYETTSMRD